MYRRLFLLTLCVGAALSVHVPDQGDYRPRPGPRRDSETLPDPSKLEAATPLIAKDLLVFGRHRHTLMPPTAGPACTPPTSTPGNSRDESLKFIDRFIDRSESPKARLHATTETIESRSKRFVFRKHTHATSAPENVIGAEAATAGSTVEATTAGIAKDSLVIGHGPHRHTLIPPRLPTDDEAATPKVAHDFSRTIGPNVVMPGTARPKREVGGNFDANWSSGSRPNLSGGVHGSKTNGATTWTGGINHSTDLHNGNTQVHGGFETKVGSGTVHGGAHVNVDNHGRTSHGANVGLTIPF